MQSSHKKKRKRYRGSLTSHLSLRHRCELYVYKEARFEKRQRIFLIKQAWHSHGQFDHK